MKATWTAARIAAATAVLQFLLYLVSPPLGFYFSIVAAFLFGLGAALCASDISRSQRLPEIKAFLVAITLAAAVSGAYWTYLDFIRNDVLHIEPVLDGLVRDFQFHLYLLVVHSMLWAGVFFFIGRWRRGRIR